jgi:hypothetical protein
MKILASLWNAILLSRNEPLYAARAMAILTLLAILGMVTGEELHREGLTGFCLGAGVALCGILISQLFRIGSAEYKHDPHATNAIELHLSN